MTGNAASRKYKQNHPDRIKEQTRIHRQENRKKAIEYLGGKCIDCGNVDDRVLQFDHVKVRRNNGRTISAMFGGSWDRLKKHLDDCELVCANCHVIRTLSRPKFVNK